MTVVDCESLAQEALRSRMREADRAAAEVIDGVQSRRRSSTSDLRPLLSAEDLRILRAKERAVGAAENVIGVGGAK